MAQILKRFQLPLRKILNNNLQNKKLTAIFYLPTSLTFHYFCQEIKVSNQNAVFIILYIRLHCLHKLTKRLCLDHLILITLAKKITSDLRQNLKISDHFSSRFEILRRILTFSHSEFVGVKFQFLLQKTQHLWTSWIEINLVTLSMLNGMLE